MTRLGLSSTSDVITFDQNWHHLLEIDFDTYRFCYSVARDLYCCMVMDLYFACVVVDSEEKLRRKVSWKSVGNSGEKS